MHEKSHADRVDAHICSHDKARVLSEALPFMQRYSGRTVVIKYGGHAIGDDLTIKKFAQDIVLLVQSGVKPVIVHGGGPQIRSMMDRLGIPNQSFNGLRVTDEQTIKIVEMVLSGSINKHIVSAINAVGGCAVGLSGKDGNMVIARPIGSMKRETETPEISPIDLGFVGTPDSVNRGILDALLAARMIPVIAPIAPSAAGETYNINADTFAGSLAGALDAERLLLLTDIPGVLDKNGNLIRELSSDEVHQLIADGTITGGMIPKVDTCLCALAHGVRGVVILDGRIPHAALLELYTEHGEGTIIRSATNPAF